MTSAAPLKWTKQQDGSWTAEEGRFRAARLSTTRWALEDSQRGTGSILERTEGVYPTLRAAQAAARRIREKEPTGREPRRKRR